MALDMSRNGAEAFVRHRECAANKAKPEASLKAFESKLPNFQQRVQKLDSTNDTVDQLASKVGEAKKALGASQKHVFYLQEKLAE